MKVFIAICFILAAFCGLMSFTLKSGESYERERIYNKCLVEQQNKLYIEAVNICKERVK